jgi:hypothetical protein
VVMAAQVGSAPSRGRSAGYSGEDLGCTEQRHSHINARNHLGAGFKLRRNAVRFSIVRIIKPAVFPAIGTIGLKVPEDRQAAELTVSQCRIGILVVLVQLTLRVARNFQP